MNLVAKVFYIGNQVIQMSNQVAGVESLSDAARKTSSMGLVQIEALDKSECWKLKGVVA
jgi:hypothetical protein